MKEPAHVAYDAYGDSLGWFDDRRLPLPIWDHLDERFKDAWRAAVGALFG